jgi:hypothetical protein
MEAISPTFSLVLFIKVQAQDRMGRKGKSEEGQLRGRNDMGGWECCH